MVSLNKLKAANAEVTMSVEDKDFQKGINRATTGMQRFRAKLTKLRAPALAVAAAVAAVAAATVKIGNAFADNAIEAQKLGDTYGLSADQVSVLQSSLRQVGVDADRLDAILDGLVGRLYDLRDPTSDISQQFELLGLDRQAFLAEDLEGQLKLIADVIKDMDKNAALGVLDEILGGDAAVDAIKLLEGGSEAMEKMKDNAREAGVIISEDMSEAAKEYNSALKETDEMFTAITNNLGEVILPFMTEVVKQTNLWLEGVKEVARWLNAIDDEIELAPEMRVNEVIQGPFDDEEGPAAKLQKAVRASQSTIAAANAFSGGGLGSTLSASSRDPITVLNQQLQVQKQIVAAIEDQAQPVAVGA